jgi:hypothetical protein
LCSPKYTQGPNVAAAHWIGRQICPFQKILRTLFQAPVNFSACLIDPAIQENLVALVMEMNIIVSRILGRNGDVYSSTFIPKAWLS